MLIPSSIERIIAYGGGVSISATKYIPTSLERFAAYAANSGATLIIRDADRLIPTSLERIAAYGKGKVIFQFD
jgi:hypothetical protein